MSQSAQSELHQIIGRAALEEASANPTFRGQLRRMLEERLRSSEEREAAGLAGLLADGDHTQTGD